MVNRKKSNCHDRLPVFINCKPVYYSKPFSNRRVKTRRINSRSISLSRQNNVDISSIWTISNGLYNNNIVYIIWSILHGAFDLLVIDYYCRSMIFQIFLTNTLPVEIVSQLRWECMNKSLCRIRSKNQLILSDAHMNFEVSKPSNLSVTTIELTPEQWSLIATNFELSGSQIALSSNDYFFTYETPVTRFIAFGHSYSSCKSLFVRKMNTNPLIKPGK